MGIPFPEEYGGSGADTLSLVLALEELARVDCAVAITVSAHTSLATMPIHLWGDGGAEGRVAPGALLRPPARGLRTERAGGRHGRGQHQDDRGTRRRGVGDRREQGLHHEPGHGHHGLRRHHGGHVADRPAAGDLEPHRPERHSRLRDRRALPEARVARLRHAATLVHRLPRARGEPARPARRRVPAVHEGAGGRADRGRSDRGRARAGRARRGACVREGAARVRAADLQVPGDPGQARRRLRAARGGAPADVPRGPDARSRRAGLLAAAQAKLVAGRLAVRATEEAVQIHGGYGFIEDYPVAASTGTRRSSRSAKAPTRCSRWSSPSSSAAEAGRGGGRVAEAEKHPQGFRSTPPPASRGSSRRRRPPFASCAGAEPSSQFGRRRLRASSPGSAYAPSAPSTSSASGSPSATSATPRRTSVSSSRTRSARGRTRSRSRRRSRGSAATGAATTRSDACSPTTSPTGDTSSSAPPRPAASSSSRSSSSGRTAPRSRVASRPTPTASSSRRRT